MILKTLFQIPLLLSCALLTTVAFGQAASSGGLNQAEIDQIIRRFTSKETQFRQALNQYSFRRDATVQSLGMGGQVTGEYHRVSLFTFDDSGNRYEKINFFPMPSFGGVTPEDLDDLGGINPFALEPSKIDRYNFRYVGKERIDELNLHVFDVSPKSIPDPKKTKERLFVGRIWVDDQDLQIVKTKGKGVPETKINKFPVVDTYREQIDGRWWFPTYSYADEELIFDDGQVLHIRMQVKYSDFVKAHATVTVTEVGEVPGSATSMLETSDEQPVDGGVLNSKARDLPKPKYPEEARKANVIGRVTVKVLIDEKGNLVSAEAIEGPEILRASAVEAARRAKFTLTLIGTRPVKVSGVLVYDFAPETLRKP